MKPTQKEVIDLFDFDVTSGIFTRKTSVAKNTKAGDTVGWLNGCGYLNVRINRKVYKVHQIVWLYVTGNWPNGVIDHINRIKTDNRFENLRDTTITVNNLNRDVRKDSKTGIPNVTWRERDKCFYASCRRNGKLNYIGKFQTVEDASFAVDKFKAEIGKTL